MDDGVHYPPLQLCIVAQSSHARGPSPPSKATRAMIVIIIYFGLTRRSRCCAAAMMRLALVTQNACRKNVCATHEQ